MGLFDFFKKKPQAPAEPVIEKKAEPRNLKSGLVAELPISVADADGYLAALKSAAGDELVWEKCDEAGEIWQSRFPSGVAYQKVYLCPGADKNPTTAPLGFTL
ncbi:MAG: hypothetical protein IKC99_03400 [Clostridia bacterium]|nr:hypothetical protein [Clostridia bacterium]